MNAIRRTSSAFLIAAALGLPALASAEQAASPLCDGTKADHKQPAPTAEQAKQTKDSKGQKSDDKAPPKSDDKTDPSNVGKTS
jgi:hypothetical protein